MWKMINFMAGWTIITPNPIWDMRKIISCLKGVGARRLLTSGSCQWWVQYEVLIQLRWRNHLVRALCAQSREWTNIYFQGLLPICGWASGTPLNQELLPSSINTGTDSWYKSPTFKLDYNVSLATHSEAKPLSPFVDSFVLLLSHSLVTFPSQSSPCIDIMAKLYSHDTLFLEPSCCNSNSRSGG